MAAPINLDTGVISGVGANKAGEVFEFHPMTGKRIPGTQIPYWEEVKAMCLKAMHVVPQVRFVAWDVASIEMDECDPRLANCHIEVACDVDNPLVGARGAAAVFGPQKGATPEMVEELEQGLQNYARVLQQQTEINVCQMAGGGAAGGMGIAATVFLNADIKPGIEIVLNAVNLAQAVQGAALVITGEGRIDSQTAGGKAPLGVASVAKQFNVPVIGIAGVLGDGVEVVHQYGIDAVFSILPRLAPLAEVLASGETNLFNSARNIACAIKIGQGIKN